MTARHARVRAGVSVLIVLSAALASCTTATTTEPGAAARTDPAPAYAAVAARYNERVEKLRELRASAVVRLKYVDEEGKSREEQGEGILQVVRPDKMALSIKKVGQMLFWFGGDETRYWLFDVVDKPLVRVGRHDMIARRAGEAGLGLDINPREMIRLLGITPLPAGGNGVATAWSKDGKLVEVRNPLGGGVTEVLSLDPKSMLPRRIELLGARGEPVVMAELENYEPVELIGSGGGRPQAAGRVTAVHPASKTELKLDLSDMRNGEVVASAFVFDELREALGVERVIDLDAAPPRRRARSSAVGAVRWP